MNKLVYIFVPNEFGIGHVLFKLFIKMLAVAMVNKTVGLVWERVTRVTRLSEMVHQ
jgi:hypothetical protein